MPITTDLGQSPYYDDYSAEKDFYKVLFRPGVSVQARELNQLQTILQQQIERFGDNLFKEGTIIEGCDMTFHPVFPYVKIKDTQTDGKPVNMASFKGLRVKNSANLEASVVEISTGYESRNPDLNTLYVRYLNSGVDSNTTTFSADQVLTVYDSSEVISKIDVNNGSSGFSNSDSVVIMSAFAVQNSAGGTGFSSGFYVGDVINNGVSANAQIVSIDSTSNSEVYILSVKPLVTNLNLANSTLWTFTTNSSIINSNTGQVANLVSIVGSGASASLVTDSLGQVDFISIVTTGTGYSTLPLVSISSTQANTTQIATANLEAKSYLAQITVANNITAPIGTGYGMTVGDGVIYQKGYFSRVSQQLAIVEKYDSVGNSAPDAKVVGFDTAEDIINSNIDTSLLDNSIGTTNSTAPGANRLKLTPTLKVLSKAEADSNVHFFAISEFSAGKPFKQNRYTQYNVLGSEMAKRTYEESGNYVLDQFILGTKSPTDFSDEPTEFDIQVDAGKAYINGYRVETVEKYTTAVNKATEYFTSNSATISMNYGNYIKIKEVGGSFKFSTGDTIYLHDASRSYISNTSVVGTSINPLGNQIGVARMRSLVYDSGVPGTPECTYRLYIFDVEMNQGKNFKNVKSVYYTGSYDGIADVVLTLNATSNTNIAQIFDNNLSGLAFYSGVDAVKTISNVSYIYRTVDEGMTANTAGIITKSISAPDTFPYSGSLTSAEKSEIIVVPLANTETANVAGQTVSTSGNSTLVGTSTSYLTHLSVGDYIKVANSTASFISRIQNISNNTVLTLAWNAPSTITGNTRIYLLQNLPIRLDRTGRTANVSANGTLLTINLGSTFSSNTPVSVTCNIKAANVASVAKTVHRDVFVRLRLANNVSKSVGPWCLGLSDVFRLKGVYKGANNTFAPGDTGIENVTNDFYIDHNQNENYYDASYLMKKNTSVLALANSDVLLVKLDSLTTASEGLKHLGSYPISDSANLTSSTSTMNTLEIPEMYDSKDNYYDLRDIVDLRPIADSTANVSAISSSDATINPVEATGISKFGSDDKKFPAPDSDLVATIEYYVPRIDRVVIGADGNIRISKGVAGSNTAPEKPSDSLIVNDLIIPPYPSLPIVFSSDLMKIADTKIANEKFLNKRIQKYTITTPVSADQRLILQPKAYKMEDIAGLERRIKDLEYYVSFSLAELAVKQRVIPSSVSPNTDRFKFGFFVDSFSDYGYSDTDNPEYLASIVESKLSPRTEEINIEFIPNISNTDTIESLTGDLIILPFNEATILSQMVATDGPVVIAPPVVVTPANNTTTTGSAPTTPTTITVVNQSIISTVIDNKHKLTNRYGTVHEDHQFFMSSLPGPVELYFNFRDNKDCIEVFYSKTPTTHATNAVPKYNSLNCVSLSGSDSTTKAYGLGKFESLDSPTIMPDGKYAVEDAGKLLWTHNPTLGRYVTVRVTKYYKSGGADNWSGVFHYRIFYPTDTNITVSKQWTPSNWFAYKGTVTRLSPASFSIQTMNINTSDRLRRVIPTQSAYIADSQIFSMSITGLKPNTSHNFYLDGVNHSSKCKQIGKSGWGNMISDNYGILTFDYYYDAGINEITSNFEAANRMAAASVGKKSFNVKSSDNLSSSSGTIDIKSFVTNQLNINRFNIPRFF